MSMRVEVEVFRLGGPDVVDGQSFPRSFGPKVQDFGGAGWVNECYVPFRETEWAVRVNFSALVPAEHTGWLKGELRLKSQDGATSLGHAQPFRLFTEPCGVPTSTLVPVTLVYGGQPVEVGVFMVTLRVPIAEEYAPPLPRFTPAQLRAAAGS